MKVEKFPYTREPLHWWRWVVGREEVSEPRRRTQQQGCREQSGEIPAQGICADQLTSLRGLSTHPLGWVGARI